MGYNWWVTTQRELLDLAIELARKAGDILREGREQGFSIESKASPEDVVTEVDKRSEAFIVGELRARRPEDGILGEEGTSIESQNGIRWVIDPLDGTVNFTYGLPFYCVSVGVEVQGERTVGAIYAPALNELFTGAKGEGAFLNGRPIRANEEHRLSMSLVATGFSYHSEQRAIEAAGLRPLLPAVRDLRRNGAAAMDLCSVACGRLDAYFERSIKPWDVAAGEVIAREAGAVVTGLMEDDATADICAANPALHSQLRSLVTGA